MQKIPYKCLFKKPTILKYKSQAAHIGTSYLIEGELGP